MQKIDLLNIWNVYTWWFYLKKKMKFDRFTGKDWT